MWRPTTQALLPLGFAQRSAATYRVVTRTLPGTPLCFYCNCFIQGCTAFLAAFSSKCEHCLGNYSWKPVIDLHAAVPSDLSPSGNGKVIQYPWQCSTTVQVHGKGDGELTISATRSGTYATSSRWCSIWSIWCHRWSMLQNPTPPFFFFFLGGGVGIVSRGQCRDEFFGSVCTFHKLFDLIGPNQFLGNRAQCSQT